MPGVSKGTEKEEQHGTASDLLQYLAEWQNSKQHL